MSEKINSLIPNEVQVLESKCPHCGASLKKYWHVLTPILVKALVKVRKAVYLKGENNIHLLKEMPGDTQLEIHEWNNFTKLRFHGLVAKYKDADGKHLSGRWLITKRGFAFLRGELEVPARVLTFRNRVVEHDPRMVKLRDVIGMDLYVEDLPSIEFEFQEINK